MDEDRHGASRALAPTGDADRLRPGQWLGSRYRLVRPLGAGAMATVWEAEDPALARRFALKLPRDPSGLTAAELARFRREARTAASIDHANVVRVVDYHVDRRAGPYLVMELLSGETLSRALAPGVPISLPNTVEWLAHVASALDAIHRNGLVHRDVKPANIIRLADRRTVKLVDFGLAAHADGRDRITRRGMLVGTPQYMAPEVAEGSPATPASDVYSLAVVAFRLLTGNRPRDEASTLRVAASTLAQPAPSLAERSGRMFTVPLERAFSEALGRDPSVRPPSATAFVERLAGCLRR